MSLTSWIFKMRYPCRWDTGLCKYGVPCIDCPYCRWVIWIELDIGNLTVSLKHTCIYRAFPCLSLGMVLNRQPSIYDGNKLSAVEKFVTDIGPLPSAFQEASVSQLAWLHFGRLLWPLSTNSTFHLQSLTGSMNALEMHNDLLGNWAIVLSTVVLHDRHCFVKNRTGGSHHIAQSLVTDLLCLVINAQACTTNWPEDKSLQWMHVWKKLIGMTPEGEHWP